MTFCVNALQFSYGEGHQLQANFCCQPGETLSLIGPSGSGKSTLLSLIGGFLPADAGQVLLAGKDISQLSIQQRPIANIFQQHNLFHHLDVWTNIALGIHPNLKLNDHEKQKLQQAMAAVGLTGLEKRLPQSLSGGQQARVALARALVREARVLLLDEPFAALGPGLRQEILGLIQALVRSKNIYAILVSHQPEDALFIDQNTAFMHQGQIVAWGQSRQLLQNPQDPLIQAYLGRN